MYFFALSHAPPELAIINANVIPEIRAPPKNEAKPAGTNANPTTIGQTTARIPGNTISFKDASVLILIQDA